MLVFPNTYCKNPTVTKQSEVSLDDLEIQLKFLYIFIYKYLYNTWKIK